MRVYFLCLAAPGMVNALKVTHTGSDFAELEWKKPSTDGGSSIIGYLIEKQEVAVKLFNIFHLLSFSYCY